MPRIAQFAGVVVWMYYRDHNPPHFHASYGEDIALIELESLNVYEGHLPGHVLATVREWATANRAALRANWARTQRGEPLERI